MPKFFYTVVVAALLAWLGVFYIGSEIGPDSTPHILTFMFSFFIAAGITLSIIMFIYFNHKASLFMNRHILYKRSLKYGYFGSLAISGVLTLRAFALATTLNYILFAVLCLLLYTQFKGSRV